MTPTKSQSLSPKPYNLYKPKKKKKNLYIQGSIPKRI